MVISIANTKAMTNAATPVRSKLVVDDEIVEQIMEVSYLGITITSHGSIEKEVNYQITRANSTSGCLNNT